MQRIKRNWFRASALKKIVVITGICFMLFMAFFSILPLTRIAASCNPAFVASYQNKTTAAQTLSITYTAAADQFAVVNYEFQGSYTGTLNVTDSLGSIYHDLPNGLQSFGVINGIGSDTITVTASSWSSTTNFVLDVIILSCMDGYSLSNTVTYQNGGSGTSAPTQTAFLTSQVPIVLLGFGVEELESVSPTFTFNTAPVFANTNTKQYSAAAGSNGITEQVGYNMAYQNNNQGFQLVSTNSGDDLFLAYISFQSSAGCGVYACQTITYTISYTNETCVGSGCTATTTSTTINYDSTSTVVTFITCAGSNCVTRVITNNKTVTFTDTSVSLVTRFTTSTRTNTALNSPSGFSLQFWLVPLIFLMGPAFGFMGAYGSVTRERGGNVASNTALLFFLLGLNLGAIGGIILKVMPFPVLVLTFIPLVLLLYSMR